MPSCEKCWNDAYAWEQAGKGSHAECYEQLRKQSHCTPEEQAGKNALSCPYCNRKTVHQIVQSCMVHGCNYHNIGKYEE